MKKILIALFLSIVSIAGITGCSPTINTSHGGTMTFYPELGPVDDYRPIYTADENIKVSGNAKFNVLFGIFVWGDGEVGFADNADIFANSSFLGPLLSWIPNEKNLAAKAAFYDACKSAQCDTIVAARYEVKKTNYIIFSKCEVEVVGFPATLTSLEKIPLYPYYISQEGKTVKLDRLVKPVKVYDERSSGMGGSSGGLLNFLPF